MSGKLQRVSRVAALLVNKWSNYLLVKMFDVRIEASRPHGCGLMTGQSNGQIFTGQSFLLVKYGRVVPVA